MKHTFLFEEGIWYARGVFHSGNEIINVEGKTTITHSDIQWTIDGYMELPGENPVTLTNKYEMKPFNSDFTSWKSFNPSLGTLTGKFMVVDDTIISEYITEDGLYSGVESLIKVNDTLYKARGFAFRGNEKLSSWSVDLVRK